MLVEAAKGSLGVGRASSSKSWLCLLDVGVAREVELEVG